MIAEKRKPLLQLAAAVLLAVMLLTACASKATNAADKIELGQKYLTELNYTEAVAAFTEVIGLDPENIEAYMGRAEAYKGLKQYDDAKADYTTAIEKQTRCPIPRHRHIPAEQRSMFLQRSLLQQKVIIPLQSACWIRTMWAKRKM